jgi:hypothetical protein
MGADMADRVLLFSWGTPVRGREERALEVFNESVGLYGKMQQDGRIEKFDLMLFEPNGLMDGCVQLHGAQSQLDAVRESDDFQRLIADATLIVDDIKLVAGVTNAGVAEQMAIFQEAISKVPQMA